MLFAHSHKISLNFCNAFRTGTSRLCILYHNVTLAELCMVELSIVTDAQTTCSTSYSSILNTIATEIMKRRNEGNRNNRNIAFYKK